MRKEGISGHFGAGGAIQRIWMVCDRLREKERSAGRRRERIEKGRQGKVRKFKRREREGKFYEGKFGERKQLEGKREKEKQIDSFAACSPNEACRILVKKVLPRFPVSSVFSSTRPEPCYFNSRRKCSSIR